MRSLKEGVEKLFDFLQGDSQMEPSRPVGKEETIIGQANSKVKDAYIEAIRLQSEVLSFRERRKDLDRFDADASNAEAKVEDVEFRLYRAQLYLNKTMSDLFLAVSEDYPEIRRKRGVAIRKGWLIVSLPEEQLKSSGLAFEIPSVNDMFIQA